MAASASIASDLWSRTYVFPAVHGAVQMKRATGMMRRETGVGQSSFGVGEVVVLSDCC